MEETRVKKIIVIGSPGAGKSTFSRKLRNNTTIPLYYLDLLWHNQDKTTVSEKKFDQCLQNILKKEEWIIDGNYLRTLDIRLKACDTVFFLNYPLDVCLDGAESRIGKPREDMPWVESEFDQEFKQWIIDFQHTQLPTIHQLIEAHQDDKTIFTFNSRNEAESYFQQSS